MNNKKVHLKICVVYLFIIIHYSSAAIFCKTDNDCYPSQESICHNGMCECKYGKVYNTDYTNCLSVSIGPDFKCEDDRQCNSWLIGQSECRMTANDEGYCSCKEGYRYYQSKCIPTKQLKDECTSDEECHDGIIGGFTPKGRAMVCTENACTCNEGFYERKGVDCRPMSRENEACVIDMDCPQSASTCVKGICTSTQKIDTKLLSDDSFTEDEFLDTAPMDKQCTSDKDCTNENSFCAIVFEKCMCKDGFVFDKKKQCVPGIGDTCTSTCVTGSKCNAVDNSLSKICECTKYQVNGNLNQKCFKPTRNIGESCVHDRSCYTFGMHAVCINRNCQCKEGYTLDKKASLCTKVGSINGCTSDDDCKSKGNFKCDIENEKCICMDNYHPKNNKCLPDIGTLCDVGDTCDGENVICISNKCNCKEGYLPFNEFTCIKGLESIDQSCEADAQCNALLNNHGQCKNNTCECLSDYLLSNETGKAECLKKKYMGDMCRTLRDCKVMLKSEQVVCKNSICTCQSGYKESKDNMSCETSGASTMYINLAYFICTYLLYNYFNITL